MTTPPLPLLYILHSGELYGTERMAVATLAALREDVDGLLLAPPGPALDHARAAGVRALAFSGRAELLRRIDAFLRGRREAALIATGISQSLLAIAVARLRGVRLRHLHAVHGGADEKLSYGRKKWLLPFAVEFVAVSRFVRARLIAHGVSGARIRVIGNFLTRQMAPRAELPREAIRRIIVISRLDPIKRVDLLLDALALLPEAGALSVRVFGTGWEEAALRLRAAREHPNVAFAGYTPDIASALHGADLLVHTCPEEPFGLVVLEAMAAGVPVLVPDRGGPSEFVTHGVDGFVYRAGNAAVLAVTLGKLQRLAPGRLDGVIEAAQATVRERYSAPVKVAEYRAVLEGRSAWA